MNGPSFSEVYGGSSVLFAASGARGDGERLAKARAQAEANRGECRRIFSEINGERTASVPYNFDWPEADKRPQNSGWLMPGRKDSYARTTETR